MGHRVEGVLVGRYSIQLHTRGSSGGETDYHKPGSHTATEDAKIAQLLLIIASAMVKRSCFCIYMCTEMVANVRTNMFNSLKPFQS